MFRKLALVLVVPLLLAAFTATAQAQFIYSGQAIGVDFNGTLVADTGPLPPEGGSRTASFPGINMPPVLTTGLITADTMGVGGVTTSNANTATLNSNLTSVGLALIVTNADLATHAVADDSTGTPTATGSIMFTGTVTFMGAPLTITGAPNQTFTFGPVTLTFNEQSKSMTPESANITVNGAHLIIPGLADVIIGHAEAGIAVPEPGSLTLLGLGTLGLVGYVWRRRRAA
jgi:hypothetical protein